MALTWIITPAPDGNQYSQYKDGDVPAPAPPVPTNLRNSPGYPTFSTAKILFDFPTNWEGHTGFDYEYWETATPGSVTTGTLQTSVRSFQIEGLTQQTDYTVQIRAFTGLAKGEWSDSLSIQTPLPSVGDTDLTQIYYYTNFEDGNEGQHIPEFTEITTTQATCYVGDAYAGTKCAVNTILQGDSGWTRWGFLHSWKEHPLVEGDQVWCRLAFKCPPDFSWQSTVGVPAQFGGTSLKFWRLRGRVTEYVPGYEGDTQEAGCCDTHIIGTGSQNSPYGCMGFRTNTEWQSQRAPDSWPPLYDDDYFSGWDYSFTEPFDCREWHMVEIAYVIGDPQIGGGIASIKMWLDGRYLGEDRNSQTAVPHDSHKGGDVVGGERTEMLLSTYWNGEAPQDNTWYFDQWTVAIKCASTGRDDTPHLAEDSQGNKFIGLATL